MSNKNFSNDDDFSIQASRKQKIAKKIQKQHRNHSWVDDLDEEDLSHLDQMGIDVNGLK